MSKGVKKHDLAECKSWETFDLCLTTQHLPSANCLTVRSHSRTCQKGKKHDFAERVQKLCLLTPDPTFTVYRLSHPAKSSGSVIACVASSKYGQRTPLYEVYIGHNEK